MKKILTTLALVLTITTMYAFKGEEAVNSQALRSFNRDFVGATDASWTAGRGFYKVTFSMNDQQLSAFYNTDGEFMAVARNISSFQLSLNLQRSLKKSYSNYWISDLFEMNNEEGTSYYVTLESADVKIILKSNGSGWSVYQKMQKA